MKESQLNLVDLAGSERQKDTNAVGQRLKVSERPIHVLSCTHSFTRTYVNELFFYLQSQTNVSHKKYSKVHVSAIYMMH